jgi:site-specific DNA-methyltransferase (adenine-specific)
MEKQEPKSIAINADNMEVMESYPSKYFDLAIVDPPYGIDITSECMGGRKTIKPDSTKSWDKSTPTDDYFKHLFRVSKNQIIWGGNYFKLPNSRYFAIWDKGETMYGRDFAEAEYAWVYSGGTRICKINPNQNDRIHPTQKPIALYTSLLNRYAKQGDKILDTHLGSGSSRIACHKLGFDFVGIELDKDYFDAQEKRFKEYSCQMNLF